MYSNVWLYTNDNTIKPSFKRWLNIIVYFVFVYKNGLYLSHKYYNTIVCVPFSLNVYYGPNENNCVQKNKWKKKNKRIAMNRSINSEKRNNERSLIRSKIDLLFVGRNYGSRVNWFESLSEYVYILLQFSKKAFSSVTKATWITAHSFKPKIVAVSMRQWYWNDVEYCLFIYRTGRMATSLL